MSLEGKVALVTGGGTGLGRAISLALGAEGVNVGVNYRVSEAEAEETRAELLELGVQALAVRADVSLDSAVRTMTDHVAHELGPIDILVNNAGTARSIGFDDLHAVSRDDWETILGVNVIGAFLCAQAVAPEMYERRWGRVLNVASTSAFCGFGSSIPYVVSKAAVVSLTQCLARALRPHVLVNAVAPAWMSTRWMKRYAQPEVQKDVETGTIPSVSPADAAQLAVELIRNDAITGQAVVIDGGELLS